MWSAYLRELAPEETQAEIAASAGVTQTTVGRWLRGEVAPSAGRAAFFAQQRGRNPIEALVAAGLLSLRDAGPALSEGEQALLTRIAASHRERLAHDVRTVRTARKRPPSETA
jgi:transcriptional regulator with XRE-family HTH domain